MKHSRSSAEVEIRDAVVARLRELRPDARIVHELNVGGQGSNRVDVAAITTRQLILVEIKSERDTLDRLAEQCHAFGPCCHSLIIAAHEKWFASPGVATRRRSRMQSTLQKRPDGSGFDLVEKRVEHAWEVALPSPIEEEMARFPHWSAAEWRYPASGGRREWDIYRYQMRTPWPVLMLNMLWHSELQAACARLRVSAHPRATRTQMIASILQVTKGWEIEAEVCHALRGREFAEADAPIVEGTRA